MNTSDNDIKKALQDNLERIEDNAFTSKIVASHLGNKKVLMNRTFTNFLSMIIGLSIVSLSIGLVLLIRLNPTWIENIGLTENHGLIILTLGIIFLIYKLMEEITAPNTQYT